MRCDEIAQPLLVHRAGFGLREEFVLVRAGTTIGRVVRIKLPIVVAAPVIGGGFKHAVVIEAQHDVNAVLLGEPKQVVQLPRAVEPVIHGRAGFGLYPKGPGRHPEPRVVLTRRRHRREPIIKVECAPPMMPTHAMANQRQRPAVPSLKMAVVRRDPHHAPSQRRVEIRAYRKLHTDRRASRLTVGKDRGRDRVRTGLDRTEPEPPFRRLRGAELFVRAHQTAGVFAKPETRDLLLAS